MPVAWGAVKKQSDGSALGFSDAEVKGLAGNIAQLLRGDVPPPIEVVARGIVLFRGVDADQTDLAEAIDLESVAIVDPGDFALQNVGGCGDCIATITKEQE